MKKYLAVSILTLMFNQTAHAQNYLDEHVEHNKPQYITINGTRYVRIPQNSDYQSQSYRYQQNHYTKSNSNRDIETSIPPRLYIGGDFSGSFIEFSGSSDEKKIIEEAFKNKTLNYTGVLGIQFTPHISAELFYQQSNKAKKNFNIEPDYQLENTISYTAYGLDILASIPLTQQVDFIFGLGAGIYDAKVKLSGKINYQNTHHTYSETSNSEALRFNLGTQYYITDDLALRLMGRYVHFLDDEFAEHMLEISAGLRYYF